MAEIYFILALIGIIYLLVTKKDMKTYKGKKLYKVLVDGKSCHGGDMEWSLPKKVKGEWIPGKWQTVKGDIEICSTGIHLTTERFKWYKLGCTAYEAEAKEVVSWEDDKCVARSVRLIKEVSHPKWWTDVNGWIGTLKDIAWLQPDGKPKKEWKLFETRDAAWDAARAVAWDVARAVARDAAWDAAWAVARDAAWDAARDAAWDVARDVAWDAARDARLYAGAMVSEWNFESKHRTHIKKRMEVWTKGYGLLGDVDGVLYVYKICL